MDSKKSILLFLVAVFHIPGVKLQGCFTGRCPVHGTLEECSTGQWTCQQDEFCQIATRHALSIRWGQFLPYQRETCRPLAQLEDCLTAQGHDDQTCKPDQQDTVCHWCCVDETCVHTLARTAVYETPAKHCFDGPCPVHGSLEDCSRGNWLCDENEYCDITANHTGINNASSLDQGYYTLHCRPIELIDDCVAHDIDTDNTGGRIHANCHTDHAHPQDESCRFCCDTEACVHELANTRVYHPPTTTTSTTTISTTTTTTSTSTTTTATTTTTTTTTDPKPTTTTEVCVDRHHGDCAAEFDGMCGETLVQFLCAKTCELC